MKDNHAPKTIYLKDYQAPNYWIETTELEFELEAESTRVTSLLSLYRNENGKLSKGGQGAENAESLTLSGADLKLLDISIDGTPLSTEAYRIEGETLTIEPKEGLPNAFKLKMVTEINPKANTSLEGLYLSNGMFCTQCEAEGFRKITYFLDRPDVMSIFTTKIIADKKLYPTLLSNGNCIETGELGDGKHWVKWHDPFKKPSYLFALVGGDLSCSRDTFTTCTGREIKLEIFVEPQDIDKCEHAMASLKRSMKWDEEVYGREYDLDIYMIVAVSHFNMGAMENKGLNIFNTACVLAHPKMSTDDRFERVEAIIAHEYFHNWSGNRVTCRDWFQLSLKEGFTVFRDQEYSADMGSRAVKRVEDVRYLKTVQFAEDGGPMAHPVRPPSYIEINNFYTVTVYDKGAEVVRMVHTLLGADGFRKGSDLYFDRHDGAAVTTDDFIRAMEDANGVDLTQFKRWYEQAGTPELEVQEIYDAANERYQLKFLQSCPPTPKQSEKLPFHIPVSLGLVKQDGSELNEHAGVVSITEREQIVQFEGVKEKPIPSLLRGFSSPVRLKFPYTKEQLKVLMVHDSDPFNRWEASNQLALGQLFSLLSDYQQEKSLSIDEQFVEAVGSLLKDTQTDRAAIALMLTLPSEAYMAEESDVIDVDGIHAVRQFVRKALSECFQSEWMELYQSNSGFGPYSYDADSIAKRKIKHVALGYLGTLAGNQKVSDICVQQYQAADNMTDQMGALAVLVREEWPEARTFLDSFYEQWKQEPLVVDQWFSLQASVARVNTLEKVKELLGHEAFELTNPNKVRALIGAFCNSNPISFHRLDGQGYQFLGDYIIKLNEINPQMAARMLSPLSRWRRYDEKRQQMMKDTLCRVLAQSNLSPDVYEVASKSLGEE